MYARSANSNFSSSLLVGLVLLIHAALGQDILFPGQRPTASNLVTGQFTTSSVTHVTPKPSTPSLNCPANMTIAEDNGDKYCECLMGNLYYPKLERCYMQYTRGPCNEKEHFVLRPNATMAECVLNPCPKKDTVQYRGACHELYVVGGPCNPDKTLAIPETAHEPQCVSVTPASYQVIIFPVKPCEPGSARTANGRCRMILLR